MGTEYKKESEKVTRPSIFKMDEFHDERMHRYMKDHVISKSVFLRMAVNEKLKREGYLND